MFKEVKNVAYKHEIIKQLYNIQHGQVDQVSHKMFPMNFFFFFANLDSDKTINCWMSDHFKTNLGTSFL